MGDIYLFSGDGAGGFDSAALLHTDEWWNSTILAAGDFNGDGHIDLAARGRNSSVLYAFLGDGQWNFNRTKQSIQYSEICAELVVGDVNEDGNQDLLQAGREGLSVLLSHGDGTFGDATPLASGANTPFVPSVALADIDGDAHLDVVAALSEDNRIGVLLGDGTGQFGPAQPYAPGVSNPEWLAVADFNHDGRMDLAVLSTSDHRVGVLLGAVPSYTVAQGGLVRLNATATFDPDQDPAGLVYEWDLDGDGVLGETGAVASRGDEIGMLPNFSAAGLQPSTLWTVTLQVTDNLGLNSSDTATIYVGPPAAPPPAGALDPTFGIGGMQLVLGSQMNWMAVTVQVDGQIVIAGMDGSSVAVWRENPDGSPDRTFGSDGMALWAPAGLQSVVVGNSGVAVQNDGKIVVAGSIQFADSTDWDFFLLRFNSDGTLDDGGTSDTTPGDHFGTAGGVAITDFGQGSDQCNGLAITPDGKIVAAGQTTPPGGNGSAFALARYQPDGTPDAQFGTDGLVVTPLDSWDAAWAVALDRDQNIVAVGWAGNHFAVVRYEAEYGALDPAFDSDGKVFLDSAGEAWGSSVAVQPDGKIVVGGGLNSPNPDGLLVARLLDNGSLDPGFGTSGTVVSHGGWANSVALQADGKIVAAGNDQNATTGYDFEVARFLVDGRLDETFGTAGIVTTDLAVSSDWHNALALQPDGRILLLGYYNDNLSNGVALVRYESGPPTASITGPTDGVPGQSRTLTFGATDPSLADQAAGFTFDIDWDGDRHRGPDGERSDGPRGEPRLHVDGDVRGARHGNRQGRRNSEVVSHAMAITTVAVQGDDLAVGGTTGDDTIAISPAQCRRGRSLPRGSLSRRVYRRRASAGLRLGRQRLRSPSAPPAPEA